MVKKKSQSWSRKKIDYEVAAIRVLKDSRKPLSLRDITEQIVNRKLVTVKGKTPEKTLYGVIFKKEKLRKERGEKPVFKKTRSGSSVLYTLNG